MRSQPLGSHLKTPQTSRLLIGSDGLANGLGPFWPGGRHGNRPRPTPRLNPQNRDVDFFPLLFSPFSLFLLIVSPGFVAPPCPALPGAGLDPDPSSFQRRENLCRRSLGPSGNVSIRSSFSHPPFLFSLLQIFIVQASFQALPSWGLPSGLVQAASPASGWSWPKLSELLSVAATVLGPEQGLGELRKGTRENHQGQKRHEEKKTTM